MGLVLLSIPLGTAAKKLELGPRFSLNTGTHLTWAVSDLSEEAGVLVSASRDKTVREWDVDSGELLYTYHLPIGPGFEGNAYAVAVSPDGHTIAVGGHIGLGKNDLTSVFLIDRSSRSVVNTLEGLQNSVFELEWSHDGRFLAAGTSSGDLRIFSASSLNEVFRDKYDRDVIAIDFDSSGRMLTSSTDGFLRLYNENFKLLEQIDVREGGFGRAAFSPDGSLIALGSNVDPKVRIHSSFDLSHMFTAEAPDLSYPEGLSDVAWTKDGEHLLATGDHQAPWGVYPIFRWSKGGRGKPNSAFRFPNRIRDIQTTTDGRMLYATVRGDIVGIDADGQIYIGAGSPLAHITPRAQKLRVSDDGSTVRFRIRRFGLPWYQSSTIAQIDVNNLQMKINPTPLVDEQYYNRLEDVAEQFKDRPNQVAEKKDAFQKIIREHRDKYGEPQYPGHTPAPDPPELFSPVRTSNALQVERWHTRVNPLLNGKPLKTGGDNLAHSVALMHDNSGLVLATEYGIHYFNAEGKRQWKHPILEKVVDLNVAPNGHVVVVLFKNGTVEWRLVDNGDVLLTLALSTTAKTWVLWTPEGFFHASEEALPALGYHQNNGSRELATYHPVDTYSAVFDRPDLIKNRLGTDQSYYESVYENSGLSEATLQATHTPRVRITSRNAEPADLLEIFRAEMLKNLTLMAQDPNMQAKGLDMPVQSEKEILDAVESYIEEIEPFLSEDNALFSEPGLGKTSAFFTTDSILKLELLVDSVEPTLLEISRGFTTIQTKIVDAGQAVPVEIELPLNGRDDLFQINASNRRHDLNMPVHSILVTRNAPP